MEENKEIFLLTNPLLYGEIKNQIVLEDLKNVIDDGNNNIYSKFNSYNQSKLNDLMKNTNIKKAYCMKKRNDLLKNSNQPIMYRVNGKKEILGKKYDLIYLTNNINLNDEELEKLNCEDFMTLYCLNQIKELKQLYKDNNLTSDFNDLLLEYCPECICYGETQYEKFYEKINKIKNLDEDKKKEILLGLQDLKNLPRYQQFNGKCCNENNVWIPNTYDKSGTKTGNDPDKSITLCQNLLNISGNVSSSDGGNINISSGTDCNKYDKYTQDLDEHGFNNNGINVNTNEIYDERGFDKKGINKNTNTKFDEEGFDIDGKNKDGKTKSDLIYEEQQKNQQKYKDNIKDKNNENNNKDNETNKKNNEDENKDKSKDENKEETNKLKEFFNTKNIIIISISSFVLILIIILIIILSSKKNNKK